MSYILESTIDDWQVDQELNNNLYWRLRHAYFGAMIGDILKAIHCKSIMGAFTLSMCAISSLAELWWCNKNQNYLDSDGRNLANRKQRLSEQELFIEWVQQWLNGGKFDDKYDSAALYSLRCALVHSYGWARQLQNAALDGYRFCRGRPEKHCAYDPSINGTNPSYCLNLENLVADIILAAHNCIENLVPSETDGFFKYVKALIVPLMLDINGTAVVVNKQAISLDFFDKRLTERPFIVTRQELIEKLIAFSS